MSQKSIDLGTTFTINELIDAGALWIHRGQICCASYDDYDLTENLLEVLKKREYNSTHG